MLHLEIDIAKHPRQFGQFAKIETLCQFPAGVVQVAVTSGSFQQQFAHIREQLPGQLADIISGGHCFTDGAYAGASITIGQRASNRLHAIIAAHAQHGAHQINGHGSVGIIRILAIDRHLVEQSLGIAERAGGVAGDHRLRFVIHLDVLGSSDLGEICDHRLKIDAAEIKPLASADNGLQQVFGIGRCQDELGVGRRFLQCFQEGVRGGTGDLVGLIDDVELGFELRGCVLHPLPQVADVIDAAIAGGINFNHICRCAGVDRHTTWADIARSSEWIGIFAVDGFCQNAGRGGLARAARPAEEIGVGDAVKRDRISQRIHNVILAKEIIRFERLRTVLAVKRCWCARRLSPLPLGHCRHGHQWCGFGYRWFYSLGFGRSFLFGFAFRLRLRGAKCAQIE